MAEINVMSIEKYLKGMEKHAHFMGAVFIQYRMQTILCEGYGDAEEGVKNNPSTIFQIASLTKQFTAAAIMQLHEENKIDLGSSINRYLPQHCQCRRWKDVEVRHLLSHKSGIPDYTDCDDYWSICKKLTPDKVIEQAKDCELEFSPGTDYCYCNTGYHLLGKIIAEISQMPYAEFIQQRVLNPARMTHSGIRGPHEPRPLNAALGYHVDHLKLRHDPRDEFSVLFSDGAMYSTVADLIRWSTILDRGSPVLKPESVKLMLSQEYGLMVDNLFGSKRIYHSGSMAGFRSDFCKFPESGLTIVILSNNNDFAVEYLSSRISAFILRNKPLETIVPFPKNFNFKPFLSTFYWDDEDDDECDDDEEEEDYTFEIDQKCLVLLGDDPIVCYLLSNGNLFNASEGEEYQLMKNGALRVYTSDGELEGTLYVD